ncbi:p [Trypoxylus dichotomus]
MINRIRFGKILLMVFNTVYELLAMLMVGIGVYLAKKHYNLIQRLKRYDKYTAALIINLDYAIKGDDLLCVVILVAGSAANLLIIFNLFSIYTNNTRRMRILGFALTISCAVKLTIGCLFLITTQYPVDLRSYLQKNFNHYLDSTRSAAAQTFIEDEHDCCGIVNYSDYVHLNMSEEPDSCYRDFGDVGRILKRSGCAKRIQNHYMARINHIGLLCISVGSFEILGPISIFFLINAIRRTRTNTNVPTPV